MSVLDDLRALRDRPLDSGQRGLLAASIAVLLAVGVATFVLREDPDEDARPTSTAQSAPAAPVQPSADRDIDAVPSEEEQVPLERQASRADVDAARSAGERALSDYLDWTYGRRDPAEIRGVSDTAREDLARNAPRVRPSDVQGRSPRLTAVTTEGVSQAGAEVRALVQDGSSSYTVVAQLERSAGAWVVTGFDRT